MAVSDGAPPGGAGAGAAGAAAGAPPAAQPSPSPPSPPGTARRSAVLSSSPRAGAEDVLRAFVRSAVEQILKDAPWTFHKVNPLKEACRQFLREVDSEPAELVAGGAESRSTKDETGDVGETPTRAQKSPSTNVLRLKRLNALATRAARALVAACDSGRPALAEPALGAARELVASGCLVGTTRCAPRGATTAREEQAETDDDAVLSSATRRRDKETNLESGDDASSRGVDGAERDGDGDGDAACRALVASLCACASSPDGAHASAGSATVSVAAVDALAACAVSPEFRLEGEALADALSALLRACASFPSPEARVAAKTATTRLINAAFDGAGFGAARTNVARVRSDARDGASNRASRRSSSDLEPNESDALLVLLTLCERAAAPNSGEEKARAAERARRARGAELLAAPPDPFAAMATAFTPAAAASVALETRLARTRAVSLDLLRQLLEGPGSAEWLSRLAPVLGKPLRAALAAGVETETAAGGSDASASSSRASAPAVARADPATAASASLARAAFTSLALRARHAYKAEIARLYPRMALAPLEGWGAGGDAQRLPGAKNKLAALRVIRALASDPQVLVDVFVNYDCDSSGENLYERTIGALASSMAPGGGDQQKFRDGAVQCVLATVRSLRAWHARGAEPASSKREKEAGETSGNDAGSEASVVVETTTEMTGTGEPRRVESAPAKEAAPALSESETFASLKKKKASAEAATRAFNARPSVGTLAAVMEIAENAPRAVIDVADPAFPARAAAFLAGTGEASVSSASVDPEPQANSQKQAPASSVVSALRRRRRRGARRGALDPSAVGELLGSPDVDALRVMKAYADSHDFAGLELDEALRVFVRPFRVPGEAQKIDRLVERFAARHCECNPSHFWDSDQAYVLAFAVVMLNTDAHNPKTDPATKMSEDAFAAMAREGMRSGSSGSSRSPRSSGSPERERDGWKYASDDALRGVFRRVAANEIEMSPGLRERKRLSGASRGAFSQNDDEDDEDDEDCATSFAVAATASGLSTVPAPRAFFAPARKTADAQLAAAVTETEAALERARDLFSSSPATRSSNAETSQQGVSPFFAASDPSLARPMLETAGPPLLRAVSRAFANADDAAHAALPLEGARAILALACVLKVPALRDGLCDFLARAPGVGLGLDEKKASGSARGVGVHAVEAARTLLDLAAEARGLGETNWPVVLEAVSKMDALREAARVAGRGDVAVASTETRGETSGLAAATDGPTPARETTASDESSSSDAESASEEDEPRGSARLTRLLTCARAPPRFARGEEGRLARPRVSSVSSTAAIGIGIPTEPTRAELVLGAWLASAEGAAARNRVFADAAFSRFDDVEATGFVAALAGVAVADVWAPAEATNVSANESRDSDPNRKSASSRTTAPPLPSACPRAFAARRLAEVTARALERPRAVRAEIWSARVAPVLAGMAAHPDAAIVRAAAEGLYVSAARFAARAELGGSPAALAAAFAPFADAHRWAATADKKSTSKLARRLAAASAGRCVAAFASGKPADAPLSPCELAGWRAGLGVLRRFAADPDESTAFAALDAAGGAVAAAAARSVRAAAAGASERADSFAADAAGALLAFAARPFGEGESADGSVSDDGRRRSKVSYGYPVSSGPGAASRAAAARLRDVAVAAAEAAAFFAANGAPETPPASVLGSETTQQTDGDSSPEPPPIAGERLWLACVEALASAAAEEDRAATKTAASSRVFALERAFEVLRDDASSAYVASASWPRALRALASASLDVKARARRTANAKETWETTTRRAAAWCARRAPAARRGGAALLVSDGGTREKDAATLFFRRRATLRASFPHAHLPAMASAAAAGADRELPDVVGACCVELARALAATAAEDATRARALAEGESPDENSTAAVRERAWRGVAAALETMVAGGVAAAAKPAPNGFGASAEVSSAGAYAATAACDAAAKILALPAVGTPGTPGTPSVPEGTRRALLDVLARAHAAAAKADSGDRDAAVVGTNRSERTSDRLSLVRLETFAGSTLIAALRAEAAREDATAESRAAAADRLSATCVATLAGVVAASSPPAPPAFPEPAEETTAETDSADAWLAAAAARRDAGAAREPLAAAALDALVGLRDARPATFFRRAAAATGSAAALVAVAAPPARAAAGRFFAALATAPSWSFEGTSAAEEGEARGKPAEAASTFPEDETAGVAERRTSRGDETERTAEDASDAASDAAANATEAEDPSPSSFAEAEEEEKTIVSAATDAAEAEA